MQPGIVIVSTGRTGSTMLSSIFRQHPDLLSLSEFFVSFIPHALGNSMITGAELWRLLSRRGRTTGTCLRAAVEAGEVPEEILYPMSGGRYPLWQCPSLLAVTCPHLTDRYEELYDDIGSAMQSWPSAPVMTHCARLIDCLCGRFGRSAWVERSAMAGIILGPELMAAFPDARYVHLVRDGREVVLSMLRHRMFDWPVAAAWKANASGLSVFDGHWLHRKRGVQRRLNHLSRRITTLRAFREAGRSRPFALPDTLDPAERLRRYGWFWSEAVRTAAVQLETLPREQVLHLRHEDLVARPREMLRALMNFAGIDAHGDWLERVRHLPRKRPEKWPLLPERERQALIEACRPGLEIAGYA